MTTTPASPTPAAPLSCDAEARAFGERAAKVPEMAGWAWDEVEPRLRGGWRVRHSQVCDPSHDWRLSFEGVREGWAAAGGRFRTLPPDATARSAGTTLLPAPATRARP